MFKAYSSSSSLVITSCWFATSRLVAPVSVRLVYSIKLQQENYVKMICILCWPQWANIGNNMYLQHCNVSDGNFHYIYTAYVWCMELRKCQYSLPINFVLFLYSVMNKHLNNNIYRICFSFSFLFFWDTPGKFMIHIIHQCHFKVNGCRYDRVYTDEQQKLGTVSIQVSTVFIPYPAQYWYTHGTVRYCTCTGL